MRCFPVSLSCIDEDLATFYSDSVKPQPLSPEEADNLSVIYTCRKPVIVTRLVTMTGFLLHYSIVCKLPPVLLKKRLYSIMMSRLALPLIISSSVDAYLQAAGHVNDFIM